MTQNAKYDPGNFARFCAETTSSQFNQHLMLRFVASAGMGKSLSAIGLAEGISMELADILGGKPEDYFDWNTDFACMSTDEIERVLSNPKKYHVLLLDDVATGVGARDFQSKSNKKLSKIIQTFRPQNNIVIETLQASFLVEKIFRLLAHIEIEIESTNFPYGYVVAKVQQIDYKHKKEKVYYPYLFKDGQTWVRHLFQAPSNQNIQKYELERAKQLKRIMDKENSEEAKLAGENKVNIKEKTINLYEEFMEEKFGDMTWTDVVKANGLNIDSANVVISKWKKTQN